MTLVRIKGNWALCLAKLEGKALATAKQGMQDRIQRGTEDREHFNSGAWFAENFNVVDKKTLGARAEFNPLIPYAEQAVEAHRNGKEFYLTDEIVGEDGKSYTQLLQEIAEKDSKKPTGRRRVIDLGEVKTHNVPTDSFADDDTIVWLAQDKKQASQFGKFLKNDLGFSGVTVYHAPISDKDYARGFWLYRLDGNGRSDFDCNNGDLNGEGGCVFRVSEKTAKGSSRKITQPEVRIQSPSINDVLKYSNDYVPTVAKSDFEKGLRELWQKQK